MAARVSLGAALILAFILPTALLIVFPNKAHAAATISKTLRRPVNEIGLVGWWTFDGPDILTNVADKSGSGNNGSLIHGGSGTTTAPGKVGQALSFDGTDDYVDTSFALSANQSFSYSAWFYTRALDPVNDRMQIMGDDDVNGAGTNHGAAIFAMDSGNIQFSISDGSLNRQNVTLSVPIVFNRWYHVVLVYDYANNILRSYIDGVARDTVGSTGFTPDAAGDWEIGRSQNNYYYVNGAVDDVRVYSRALSAAEVLRLYQIGATSKISKTLQGRDSLTSGLVGHWTFDGPNMLTNVADSSGQSDTGLLSHSGSGTTTAPGRVGQSLSFDGINDYVTMGASYNGVQSVAFWIKVATSTTLQKIMDLNGTATVTIDSGTLNGNNFTSPTRYVDGVAASTINDTNWHYVAITTGTGINASALDIGRISAAYLGGSLDDVRVYNRALSAAEVLQLYNLGR